jgi:hypothetical protein
MADQEDAKNEETQRAAEVTHSRPARTEVNDGLLPIERVLRQREQDSGR